MCDQNRRDKEETFCESELVKYIDSKNEKNDIYQSLP